MKRWLTTIAMACGVAAPCAAWAQGGYTVMGGSGAPQGATGVVPPAPTGQAPVAQITPVGGRGAASPVTARRPEEYGGVTPGVPAVPPGLRRARRAPGGAPLVAWPGFQMVPGGSRLFVVLTAPVPVAEAQRNGRTRVYHLPGARILLSNNRRPLITEAFATPVARASLRPARGGADLVVELRADVEPTLSQDTGGNGYHFAFLNFPSFAAPEIARIQLPSGTTVVTTAQPAGTVVQPAAPPPAVVVGAPRPAGPAPRPGTDAERPPGIR